MKISRLGILFLTILMSCGNEHKNNTVKIGDILPFTRVDSTVTTIDLSQNRIHEIDLGDSLNKIKIEYIILDHSKGYIGSCDDIYVQNDNIYILDSRGSEAIYIFDKNGKCIKMIFAKGKGPKEYGGLHHMCVTNNRIILNDRLSQAVLYFSLDGNFIKKVINNTQFIDFSTLNDSTFIYYSWKQQSIGTILGEYQVAAGINDSITHCDFPPFPLQSAAMVSKPNYFFRDAANNKHLFTTNLSDTVYSINDAYEYYPKYVITNDETPWTHRNDINFSRNKSKYSFEGFMIETPLWIYAFISNGEFVRDIYYNTKTKEIHKMKFPNGHTMSFPKCQNNGSFVTYSSPEILMALYDNHKSGKAIIKDPNLLKIISAIDEQSNGLITIYSLNL